MKVQKLYETALLTLGKTEEGTSYSFAERVPALLNPDITVLNLFRDGDKQLPVVKRINDELDLTGKEAQGLSLCLAYLAATEIEGFPEARLALLLRQRNQVMGSFSTGMEEIAETMGV